MNDTTTAVTISYPKRFCKSLKVFVSNITVEPIVFCNYLALAFFRVVEHSGLYEVICIQNYQQSHNVDCKTLKEYPDVEDLVQKDASMVTMYLSLAYLLPAMASDIFLGAWSDKHGRKVNILLGVAGLIIASFPYTILFTFPHTSLVILLIANLIAGLTGYIAIVMISSLAYMTDIVPDKNALTVRMAQVYACIGAAQAIGSFSVGGLLKVSSLAYIIVVTEIIQFIGFFYTLIRIKQLPPLELRKLMSTTIKENKDGTQVNTSIVRTTKQPKSETSCWQDIINTLRFIGKRYKEVWHTLTCKRFGHRRCYIFLMTLMYLLFFTAENGLLHGPVISLYVFHRPFEWKPYNLAFWKGTQALLLSVGTLFGSIIMKRLLKFRETTIMLLCLTSGFCHLTLIAFSKTSWMLYLSVVIGMFANLTIPTIKSFLTQLVNPDEIGKAFTANIVTADLAWVCSTLLFNNIYKATVQTFPGTVFLFAACLLLICFLIVLWIHIDQPRTERNFQRSQQTTTVAGGNNTTRM